MRAGPLTPPLLLRVRGRLLILALAAAGLVAAAASPAATADATSVSGLSVAPQVGFTDSADGVAIKFRLTATAPTPVTVDVLSGSQEERRLSLASVPPGVEQTETWDGLDQHGAMVPDGVYRVTVTPQGGGEQQAGTTRLYGHIFPVRGHHGTRGPVGEFGAPRDGGRIHQGFDVTGACGTPLAAVRAGTVTRKGYDPVLYGNFIQIRGLGENLSYFYAHMVKPSPFKRGQQVHTGDIVGHIGQTGNAEGTPCHLHFEILKNGKPFNPEPSLQRWDRYS